MLPTQKTAPKSNLHEFTVLLYGPTKFGKSTLCSQADNALFIETEPGLNSLEVFRQPTGSWDELLLVAKELAEGKHGFKTVIIDTIDNAYRMCADYVCKKFKIEHESDLEYGKGYALVNSEFLRVVTKLALLRSGLFLISHSQEKEIEGRTGKFTKVVPTLPDKARKLILGLVDVVLFGDFEPTKDAEGTVSYKRVLRTKPSVRYEAGDRTGRLPEVIEFSFAAFEAAFTRGRPLAPPTPTAPDAAGQDRWAAAPAGANPAPIAGAFPTTNVGPPLHPGSAAASSPAGGRTPAGSPTATGNSTSRNPSPPGDPRPAGNPTPTNQPRPTTNQSAIQSTAHRSPTTTPTATSITPRATAPAPSTDEGKVSQ